MEILRDTKKYFMEILRNVYMWWVILSLVPATLAIRYKGRRCSFFSTELITQKDFYIILVFNGDIKKCLYVVGNT